MPRTITITTPENVRIEYELAGLASRGGAAVVDLLVQGTLVSIVALARYGLSELGKWPGATWATALLGIALFLITYGYYVYFETVWNGQTIGKRYARLRVVRDGGLPIDLACAALRNLVRLVDFLPVFYMIGGFVILLSSRNKRLGDYAAGTLVVKERAQSSGSLPVQPDRALPAEAEMIKNIELVTPEEFAAARRFMERRAELAEDIREQLAAKIARPLMGRLGIEDNGRACYSDILAGVVSKCIEERGMR